MCIVYVVMLLVMVLVGCSNVMGVVLLVCGGIVFDVCGLNWLVGVDVES